MGASRKAFDKFYNQHLDKESISRKDLINLWNKAVAFEKKNTQAKISKAIGKGREQYALACQKVWALQQDNRKLRKDLRMKGKDIL